jgi:hypothetical protein
MKKAILMTVAVLGLTAASAADQAGISISQEGCPNILDSVKLSTSAQILKIQSLV